MWCDNNAKEYIYIYNIYKRLDVDEVKVGVKDTCKEKWEKIYDQSVAILLLNVEAIYGIRVETY